MKELKAEDKDRLQNDTDQVQPRQAEQTFSKQLEKRKMQRNNKFVKEIVKNEVEKDNL